MRRQPDGVEEDESAAALCSSCGAYWQCEHRNGETAGMQYVAPDGPIYRDLHGEPEGDDVHLNDGGWGYLVKRLHTLMDDVNDADTDKPL